MQLRPKQRLIKVQLEPEAGQCQCFRSIDNLIAMATMLLASFKTNKMADNVTVIQ